MKPIVVSSLFALALGACQGADPPVPVHVAAADPLEAGRYLAELGGCHDCHTPGWAQTPGEVPDAALLAGTAVGFRGPWGTSYPGNLRLAATAMTADQWADMMQTRQGLPPMPWSTLNHMSRADLKALHRYLASLGPVGERMPPALPPGETPATPFIVFTPVEPTS